jgi:hypothetical protein
MFNPNAKSVKVYGPGVLSMPVGFLVAQTQGQQVDALRLAFAQSNPVKFHRLMAKFFGLC